MTRFDRAVVASALFGAAVSAAPALAQLRPPPPTDFSGLPAKLSGDEIKTTWFDGAPFVAVGPDGKAYRMVFSPDGKATRTPMTGKKPRTVSGFWRVIAEGYCSRWAGSNRERCFNVRPSADGTETVVRFGLQAAGTWKRP